MTLSTLYLGKNGTIVYSGHAGFLVSTVAVNPSGGSKGGMGVGVLKDP